MKRLVPRLDGFEPATARRIRITVSCRDSDKIAKVDGAGETREQDGVQVQIMHNGLVVEAGGYFGEWMAEIIRSLRGHHEPQEELVYHRIVTRLREEHEHGSPLAMIEFGSFWTYYGLWFAQSLPASQVVALEPDPAYLEVGRRNAALNGLTERVTFFHAAIGSKPGHQLVFLAESDGQVREVVQHDLASLMTAAHLDRVDLVLCDAQGAESILLDRARGDIEAGRVRFMVISTHHHSISGNPLTHQEALMLLNEAGAHIISEHSVSESYSGDGLIAVSFDGRDKDFVVPVSHARSRDSLFGELEYDVAATAARHIEAEQSLVLAQCRADDLRSELAHVVAERDDYRIESARVASDRDAFRTQIEAITSTKVWRWAKGPRQVYAYFRRE